MPHVTIKHFDAVLTEAQKGHLSESVAKAVVDAFGCSPHAVSIALQPVSQNRWNEEVVAPHIDSGSDELIRLPNYQAI